MSLHHSQQQQSLYVTMKPEFKKETNRDADVDPALYISYLQAKALLSLNQNVTFMSGAVQQIRDSVQAAIMKIK